MRIALNTGERGRFKGRGGKSKAEKGQKVVELTSLKERQTS